jgi:hypothetical protein
VQKLLALAISALEEFESGRKKSIILVAQAVEQNHIYGEVVG